MSSGLGPWALVLLAACQQAPSDLGVVATFRDGRITRSDIDRAVLRRPPEARTVPSSGRAQWYAKVWCETGPTLALNAFNASSARGVAILSAQLIIANVFAL